MEAEWSYDFSSLIFLEIITVSADQLAEMSQDARGSPMRQCSLNNSKAATHTDSLKICLLITQILHIILSYLENV